MSASEKVVHIAEYDVSLPYEVVATILNGGGSRDLISKHTPLGSYRAAQVVKAIRGEPSDVTLPGFNAPSNGYPPATPDRESLEALALAQHDGELRTYAEKGDTATVSVVTTRPVKTLEDLLEACEMDGAIWEVKDWKAGAWNSSPKIATYDKDGRKRKEAPVLVQLYRVGATFRRKVYEPALRALADDLIADLRTAAPSRTIFDRREGRTLVCIHTPDLHMDKVPVEGEWEAEKVHDEAIADLVAKSLVFDVAKFIFPIGNDALNTDGSRRTTTAGTAQDGLGRWQQSFRTLVRLYRSAISQMLEWAPVHVVVVPGNHDEDACFYLGEVLEAVYADDEDVVIDRSLAPRKYFTFGGVQLGFTHGKGAKLASLPMMMATEDKAGWSGSHTHEWLTGHLHHKMLEEKNGVVVRISPSLSPTDDWHRKMGYVGSKRAAEAIVFDPDLGRVGEFSYPVR